MSTKLEDFSFSRLNSSAASSTKGKRKTIDDYEFLVNEKSKFKTSELGQGSYGTVKKAKDKSNGKIYAIKIMNKKAMFQYSSKENLKREITIQKSLHHPHVVRLYTYFEDSDNVYLVLEYAENGTLFHYIRHRTKFSEKEAFIYFFQTCLGIDYLHKKNIIHRDLKPENLLLDAQGNVKLCDFGWSAETESKRHTFCGTIDYMAPEMIKNHPHDHRLDIWCLGILLFEMLHGYAPFKGRSDQEKTTNISRNAPINFDPNLSSDVVDLIKRILQPVPLNRASMLEIFQHPWMQKYEKVYNIDIMSYVAQHEEKEHNNSRQNDSLNSSIHNRSIEELGISRQSTSSNKTVSSAKIITIVDTAPLNILQKVTSEEKKFGSTGSTKASETGSFGTKSSANNIENLLKEYRQPSQPSELVLKSSSLGIKPYSYENSPSARHIVSVPSSYNSTPVRGNPIQFGDLSSNYKPTMETSFNGLQYSQREVYNTYSSYNGEQKPSRERPQTAIYEEADDEFEPKRMSRISMKNIPIGTNRPSAINESKDEGFFGKILKGIGCVVRDPAKGYK